MAGYSGTPLWKKLGYKAGVGAYVEDAPDEYRSLLQLPSDVFVPWFARPQKGMRLAHIFVKSSAPLKTKLSSLLKQLAPDGVIWVSWPKKTSGVTTDVSENLIREIALSLGLVDIKVCAIDEVWSGLKLMIRRENR